MKLNEKICYCRKKAGMSQEVLAERLGVSRQAVSKWETGDATPELGKVPLLASTFNVTSDWLLSEDEPYEEKKKNSSTSSCGTSRFDTLLEKALIVFEKIFKKYIWLCGVFISILGIYRVISIAIPLFSIASHVPDNFILLSCFYALIGVAMTVGGIILTVVLKKWCKKQK